MIVSGTVKLTPLLNSPSAVLTVNSPVTAFDGTDTVMLLSLQELTEASTVLKRTL
jgi:hypothetical protein